MPTNGATHNPSQMILAETFSPRRRQRMLRNGILLAALCLMPVVAYGQAAHGPFELELGGSGANGPNFNGFTAAVDGSLGYYISDVVELSLRQSVAYSDIAG